ncbi:MAG: hypothetical protein HN368_06960 [Spirochaetales bacterium]|nr:hypothetical protein [Spirochaetales bacterium]
MEIPLDSAVAKGIKREFPKGDLPVWPRLIRLAPSTSDLFQNRASQIARKKGIARVHLDLHLWVDNR